MNNRVAVALSGGIDSSVTALMLKNEGYDVVGITAVTSDSQAANQVAQKAELVAKKIDIPFYKLDVSKVFKEKVVEYFVNTYKHGETPNPCIMCNKYMKWGCLFEYAINDLNADYIATGHYASIKADDGIFKLYPASDECKDQLYFLFLLDQAHLKRTLFPLSEFKKCDVREFAIKNDLPSKSSKESQDICFIQAPMTTKKYLNDVFKSKTGNFVEKSSGRILGTHDGFWQYTIGQRKGIGIAAPEALYVTSIDAATNTVYVGYKDQLFSDNLTLLNVNWCYPQKERNFIAKVKIRYNMKAVEAVIQINDNDVKIKFLNPISSIAKGQACVIYDFYDGHLLGGAFI